MEKLIEFIESKQGGKMNADYKQGIDDCIDLIKHYQTEQLILSGVSKRRELLIAFDTWQLDAPHEFIKYTPTQLVDKYLSNL